MSNLFIQLDNKQESLGDKCHNCLLTNFWDKIMNTKVHTNKSGLKIKFNFFNYAIRALRAYPLFQFKIFAQSFRIFSLMKQ